MTVRHPWTRLSAASGIALVLIIFLAACSGNRPGPAPAASETVPGVKEPVISLNGTWKFTTSPPPDFWRDEVSPDDWGNIEVPGECLMQGFEIRHDVGYPYKKEIAIPADFTGQRVLLRFDGVYS